MTYGELYEGATTWAASHVAKDLMLMLGRETEATQSDIDHVQGLVKADQLTEATREARTVWRGSNVRG